MLSKKDLLKQMNISYGQLYRWKREGLIPDEWFIKKSVSTGQETYFDENLIIPRIEKILSLKGKYQIDEVKSFLSTNLNNRKFNLRELILIDAIDPFLLKEYSNIKNVTELSIIDVIIIYIFSTNKEISFENYKEVDFNIINDMDAVMNIIKQDDKYSIVISKGNIIIDSNLEIYKTIRFEDVASIIANEL